MAGPFLLPAIAEYRLGSRMSGTVTLRGKRRFSDVDLERARLLRHYALQRAGAQRLADLQYARAALVEAQDERAPANSPRPIMSASWSRPDPVRSGV